MHIKALKTLIRIAEVESFAVAAGQLDMTLSALSMQMKTLEQDLGVDLFDRSFRPPKLTPIGRRIAQQSQDVIQAEKKLLDACQEQNALSGTYRIGFVATASVRLLPLLLKNAAAKYPSVHLNIETGLSELLEEKLISGQLEAAILTASGEASAGIEYATLREEELAYAIPQGYAHLPLKELIYELPFLQFNPNSGIGKLIANHISKLSSRRNRAIGLDSVEAIMECVNQGIGFTMLTLPDIKRYSKGEVKVQHPKGKAITRKLVLATTERGLSEDTKQELLALFKE